MTSLSLLLFACTSLPAPRACAQTTPTGNGAPPFISAPAPALVQLNNHLLFPLYTNGDQTAQDRADLANLRLAQALRTVPENTTQAPEVTVGSSSGQTVLLISGRPLLTVTPADTDHAGQSADQLAHTWADTVNRAFRQTLRERQPTYLRWAAVQAAFLVVGGLVLNVLLALGAGRFKHRLSWPTPTLLWLLIILHTINLFPQTRPITVLLVTGPLRPLVICLAAGLPAAVLARLWAVVLRRLFPPISEDLSAQDRTERTFQRRATLGRVAEVSGATIIWVSAIILGVSWYGLNLSALLASAGLIGVALSFVAQDAMKDLVSGIYILADDRFGVGDTIQVGVYQGRVERLNMRSTQIRDMAGRLITISNRSIVDVANLTARWAQVDFLVGISYYDDLDRAQELLLETAQKLADEHPERILAPPELLGVDAFTDSSVMLRLIVRTPPGDQWVVARALRQGVKQAFDAAGLAILNSLYAPPPAPAHPSLGPGDSGGKSDPGGTD